MRDRACRAWNGIEFTYSFSNSGVDRLGWFFSNCKGMKVDDWTGLEDSEGVDIYCRDIIQFTWWWFDGSEQESLLTGEIVYSNENMSFQLKGVKNKEWERHTGYENDSDYLTPFSELNFEEADFSVIGNIHTTPELLGVKS